MAQYEGSYQGQPVPQSAQTHRTEDMEISGWALGMTFFACMMLLLIGVFHFMAGLVAVLDDSFYTVKANYPFDLSVNTWGWLHMIGGVIVMFAGVWLLTGNTFARIIAIIAATLSAIGSFASIPYYPVWSILLIALDIGVIWAVTTYGHYMREVEDSTAPTQ